MKLQTNTISKKIILLNKTVLDSIDKDDKIIIKNFMELGIKILEADFGFSWWKFKENKEYKLAYKSPNIAFNPYPPREKGVNYKALKTKKPFFDENVKKENYPLNFHIYVKSHITIPVWYGKNIYGNLILCYKKRHNFSRDELMLAQAIGNTAAQAITIHRLELAKNAERQLKEEKLKVESITDITHELRTPLAIIKGNVDLAMQGEKKSLKSLKEIIHDIDQETTHLSNIISDMAIITSKRNTSKNIVSCDEIPLRDLIREAIGRYKPIAYKKNITVSAKNIPRVNILGNRGYLEKMLINLIKNSISYGNKNGRTEVTAKALRGVLTINIKDNGMGISKEDLPHVFERFYRGDKVHSRGNNHSGLGLAIVKWVAEIHGGRVEVKSAPNKGSIFSVKLPIKHSQLIKEY